VTRLHAIWRGMLKRCNPANNKAAIARYAARGIYVSPEWHEYAAFKAWAEANGYSEDLTIERKDNNGPYAPWNCKWATRAEQCRNRRTTRWIEIDGEKRALAAWLEITGVLQSTFSTRESRGWPLKQALGLEPRRRPQA
jgi:hypothetical protein